MPYGKRLEQQLNVHNPCSEALELSLDWHASDERWQLELPEQVALAAGGSQTLAVPVTIAPDAPEDPVALTVRASSAAGDQATAALSLVPDSLTVPVGSHVWYPLPTELLGRSEERRVGGGGV